MRVCRCRQPTPKINKPHLCVRCGDPLEPAWTSGDRSMDAFYDAVERTFPNWPEVPEWWRSLRLQCEARELAGRKRFGMRYLGRDNIAEAFEEIADALNYLHFEQLASTRAGRDEEHDLVLSAARHLARAYDELTALRHKYRGAP